VTNLVPDGCGQRALAAIGQEKQLNTTADGTVYHQALTFIMCPTWARLQHCKESTAWADPQLLHCPGTAAPETHFNRLFCWRGSIM